MNILEQLNELSTTEVSDALDSCGLEGALLGIKAISLSSEKIIGPAFTVKYSPYKEKPSSFKNAGNYIDEVMPGSIVVIDNEGRTDCTTWGNILTEVALRTQIIGTVVHGAVRDVDVIRRLKYPLFARSVYMRSGKNRVEKIDHQCTLNISGVLVKPNDIIIADANGVVVIPSESLAEVVQKALNIKITEEAIVNSVKNGSKLGAAREKYRYDQPWLKQT